MGYDTFVELKNNILKKKNGIVAPVIHEVSAILCLHV